MAIRPSLASKYTDNLADTISIYKAAKHVSVRMSRDVGIFEEETKKARNTADQH